MTEIKRNQVNIGTPEVPMIVPKKALQPKTARGREYWDMIVGGSVILEDEVLDELIKRVNEQETAKG